jgi:thioredoxin-related protein
MVKKYITLSLMGLFLIGLISAQSLWSADRKQEEGKKTVTVDTTEVKWLPYDIGLAKAKKEKKHILVDFYTNWCYYCKKMDKEVFTQPEIIKMLNENFVAIKVNAESKNELDIDGYKISETNLAKSEYRVRGYPAYWFLKPDSERLGMLPGYQNADVMMDVLYFMKESLYDSMKFDEYMKNGGRKALSKG